jgi:hypothetical protein
VPDSKTRRLIRHFLCQLKMKQVIACALLFLVASTKLWAAGGVVGEANSCAVNFDFYSVHFTIYQPERSANEEFCRSLPGTGATLFVLDYLHDTLSEVPVDFRIIRDKDDLRQFARLKDIADLDDIDSVTEFKNVAKIETEGQLTMEYSFLKEGNYIAIIGAPHPNKSQYYQAIFPFQVGSSGLGFWSNIGLFFVFLLGIISLLRLRKRGIR